LAMQISRRTAHIACHHAGKGQRFRDGAKDIPNQCRAERGVAACEPFLIGSNSPIEGECHTFYVPSYAQIAGSHLSERAIEIGEHSVEEALADSPRAWAFELETMQIQERMKTDQLKAAVQRIGHTVVGKEDRLPSLLDHAAISEIAGIAEYVASGE
jgi:hypothetical protein